MAGASMKVNLRVVYGSRKPGITRAQFQRNGSAAITRSLKRVAKKIAEAAPVYQGAIKRAFASGNVVKVTKRGDVIRGFIVWPESIRKYGPVIEYGTRPGDPGSLPVKAVPSIKTIKMWLSRKFGYKLNDASTHRKAVKIVRNISKKGIPSNPRFDSRGFVRDTVRHHSVVPRLALQKWAKRDIRKLQIFPLRVKGP